MLKKKYLKHGDIGITTGAYVEWDAKEGFWFVTFVNGKTFTGGVYINGKLVHNENDAPYIEFEE